MPDLAPIAPPLLAWFYENGRKLPFRQHPTPYRVWVSEIMLQQTRMSAALPYYERFMAALPTVADLAACEEEQLFKLWEGLGYYSRARNLQKAARIVCERYGGALPGDWEALRELPGVGDYTAGAVASICFGKAVPAVDGNVLRVFARLYNDDSDITRPAVKRTFTDRVMAHQPPDAPGPYNEALMELGALVCTPGTPACAACPLADVCRGRAAGDPGRLPRKPPKKPRPVQPVTVALVRSPAGWLLQRRGEGGLLSGLWQPPLWEAALDEETSRAAAAALLGTDPGPGAPAGQAKHIFSHVEWRMTARLYTLDRPAAAPAGCVWATAADLADTRPLPGAFKAWRRVMEREKLPSGPL